MKADVRLVVTADGSHTAVNQILDKAYHSIHGALQESQRVYIELVYGMPWKNFLVNRCAFSKWDSARDSIRC